MKSYIPTLILMVLLSATLPGCNKDNPEPFKNEKPSVLESQFSDCKNNTKSAGQQRQYILLEAVNTAQLKITFVNAILNCCPGEIVTNVFIQDDILKVVFGETPPGGLCNCICPYDLECVIGDMETRNYDIEIYAGGDTPDAKFSFVFSSRLNLTYTVSN
ncbi:hypothetical protein [Maribellus maritimus]|uniref:hypothetical protein n=1 Tax=Maribellus maritimus TaxID=2870838 RepID=UPI001EEB4FE0|nr:hypothetical protein [Maribellus maritimus]MCG6186361.1 hypothetical protein [Maribellus maritimus]